MTTNKPIVLLPNDLVVRFDARDMKIVFLMPKLESGPNKLKRFYEFDQLKGLNADELAKEIGLGFIAFMKSNYGDDFFPDAILGEASGCDPDMSGDVNEKASYEDARLLIDRLHDHSTPADLEAITTLLNEAALNGDSDAKIYAAEKWPKLRSVFLRRIAREN